MRALSKIFLFSFFFLSTCIADPAVTYFDPGMVHSVLGVNRYPAKKEEWSFGFHISPFFQHASGARNKGGIKVPLGDRLGRWDLFPILWSDNACAAPEDKPFTQSNYPKLWALADAANTAGINASTFEKKDGTLGVDGAYSVVVKYEKIGVRFELDAAVSSGFGFAIKTGFVEYKQDPTEFINMGSANMSNTNLYPDDSALETLMTADTRCKLIERDLGLSLKRYETTAFEDTLAQLYWSNQFRYDDEKGAHVVTVAPYVGVGVWVPTGKKKDIDKAFSLSSGHDGFWGITFEGALNFNFIDTVQVNFGGGATVFETKTQTLRVPHVTTSGQGCCCNELSGIYPWKAQVRRTFGHGINFSFSMMGKNIIDTLSVYFDYLYCKHERDSISLKECDSGRSDCFCPSKLEEDSFWKSQMFQLGFSYQVTSDLSIGGAGQWHVSGVRVYKTHTVLGTVSFAF
ncbi:hypothetical protein KKA53_02825 [Candidatus Dependentiae bacterium]|nr:hypothetical protein [Candidatus Dependentiae bacterium]